LLVLVDLTTCVRSKNREWTRKTRKTVIRYWGEGWADLQSGEDAGGAARNNTKRESVLVSQLMFHFAHSEEENEGRSAFLVRAKKGMVRVGSILELFWRFLPNCLCECSAKNLKMLEIT
jgi:hypothetical protein